MLYAPARLPSGRVNFFCVCFGFTGRSCRRLFGVIGCKARLRACFRKKSFLFRRNPDSGRSPVFRDVRDSRAFRDVSEEHAVLSGRAVRKNLAVAFRNRPRRRFFSVTNRARAFRDAFPFLF